MFGNKTIENDYHGVFLSKHCIMGKIKQDLKYLFND